MVAALAGSVELRHLQVTARMEVSSEFELFEPPPVQVEDYSLMAGWVGHDGGASFYAVAGLGVAEITRRGRQEDNGDAFVIFPTYEMRHSEALNIPVQVGVTADASWIGIGAALVANLNADCWSAGLVVTGRLGKMR